MNRSETIMIDLKKKKSIIIVQQSYEMLIFGRLAPYQMVYIFLSK